MEDINFKNSDGDTINKSFNYLVNLIEKESNNNNIEIKSNDKEDSFINDYFCCKECHDKFIKVLRKFKDNKVDLTKIDWEKYSSDNSNIIVKLVTYYYNLGLQNANK